MIFNRPAKPEMNKIFDCTMKMKFVYATAIAMMAVACNSERIDEPVQFGEISVALSGEPEVDVITKAAETLDPTSDLAKEYTVRILNSSNSVKYEASLFDFKTQTLELGTYYVTAENCSETQAESGSGKKRLYGRSADITLSPENLSETAVVPCSVANALVSVGFDSSVSGKFSNLKVVLSGGTTRAESIIVEETQAGVITETWFNPSTLTYSITGIFDPSGMNKPVVLEGSRVLSAKDHIQLVVSLNLENGQILIPTVTVDTVLADPTEVSGEFNPYV